MAWNTFWFVYVTVYSIFALSIIMYRYIVIISARKIEYAPSTKKVAIVIPVYNENKQDLQRCLESVIHQTYQNKEILVIDDGSKEDIIETIKPFLQGLQYHRFKSNQGKRAAQTWGIQNTDAEIIVTVDSDTVLDKNAVAEIMKPFCEQEIGSVAGNVKIGNVKENLFTKMIGARYYNAFLVERRSQGYMNSMICNGGPLSAYRKDLLMKYLKDYNTQTFLGNKCHFGDDRRLTAYVHMAGLRTIFCETSVCWTNIPTGFKQLIKMMTRWKKSFYRETYLAFTYMWQKPVLAMENLQGLLMPFFSLFIRINILVLCFIHPIYIIWYLFIIGFMAILRGLFLLVDDWRMAGYNLMYAYYHEFVVYWINFIALVKLKDNGWGTR